MTGFDPQYKDLNKSQIKTLFAIGRNNDTTMGNLCKRIGLEKGSFTTVADSLMEKDLVQQIQDSNDRRKKLLVLTPEGYKLTRKLQEEIDRHLSNRLQLLPKDLRVKFLEALSTIKITNEYFRRHNEPTK